MNSEMNRVHAAEEAAKDFESVLNQAESLPLDEVIQSEDAKELMTKLELNAFENVLEAQQELAEVAEGLSEMETQRLNLEISRHFGAKTEEAKSKDAETFGGVGDDELDSMFGEVKEVNPLADIKDEDLDDVLENIEKLGQ